MPETPDEFISRKPSVLVRDSFLQIVFVYHCEVRFPFPAPKRGKAIVTLCLHEAVLNKRH